MRRGFGAWGPYVSAAERRLKAQRAAERLAKKGQVLAPIQVQGRALAHTFWGKAWCDNLERYSDFANRLPRGRTYLRNGSVLDLQVEPGRVAAMVSGTSLYKIKVKVAAIPPRRWTALCRESAGAIDSLVELLQGRFSQGVMERFCRQGTGLFPQPQEIELSCSCPDSASMCKHVAAVLYGIGARLDEQPELLFVLRHVDAQELIALAGEGLQDAGAQAPAGDRLLRGENLAELFGLDLAGAGVEAAGPGATAEAKPRKVRRAARPAAKGKRAASSRGRKKPPRSTPRPKA